MTDAEQSGEEQGDGSRLVLSQGHKVLYQHDGDECVGMIRDFDGDYLRLDTGISVHFTEVYGYVIYGDEPDVDLVWGPEVSDGGE